MGVINLTPDSFSDGGLFQQEDHFIRQINNFKKHKVSIIDIGAESTAPFNDAISVEEEVSRLTPILTYLKTLEKDSLKVSLDTYKPEVALWFFSELSWDYGIWNDISGSIDDNVTKFLESFHRHEYIFCHNNSPSRELASNHMEYVSDECIKKQIQASLELSFSHNFSERIVFDPCFGFSKTYKQNWDLINNWPSLFELCGKKKVVFGVSKKSFMRKKVEARLGNQNFSPDDLFRYSEFLHFDLINNLISNSGIETWVRAHDPMLVNLALSKG